MITLSTRKIAFVGAVAALFGATAATAETAQPNASAAVAAVAAVAPAPEKKYCTVMHQSTGTIIDRKICKTRDQWIANGFDPLAKK